MVVDLTLQPHSIHHMLALNSIDIGLSLLLPVSLFMQLCRGLLKHLSHYMSILKYHSVSSYCVIYSDR